MSHGFNWMTSFYYWVVEMDKFLFGTLEKAKLGRYLVNLKSFLLNALIKHHYSLLDAWMVHYMLGQHKLEKCCLLFLLTLKIVTKCNGILLQRKFLLLVVVTVFWNFGIILFLSQTFLVIEHMRLFLVYIDINSKFGL